ncbi:MAG: hypothetical protein AAGK47_00580 [Bacteroidota bacterium]
MVKWQSLQNDGMGLTFFIAIEAFIIWHLGHIIPDDVVFDWFVVGQEESTRSPIGVPDSLVTPPYI